MANKLSIFGEDSVDLSAYTGSGGAVVTDDNWSTGDYATLRKSGFVPGTPASSVAMNTALRQATLGAKLLGEILTQTRHSSIALDFGTDLIKNSQVDAYAKSVADYINTIKGLLNGSVSAIKANNATYAEYAVGRSDKPINTILTELETAYADLVNKAKNGEFNATSAKNYLSGGNIEAQINTLQENLQQLTNAYEQGKRGSASIPFTTGDTNPFKGLSFKVYKRNNICYSKPTKRIDTITKTWGQIIEYIGSAGKPLVGAWEDGFRPKTNTSDCGDGCIELVTQTNVSIRVPIYLGGRSASSPYLYTSGNYSSSPNLIESQGYTFDVYISLIYSTQYSDMFGE